MKYLRCLSAMVLLAFVMMMVSCSSSGNSGASYTQNAYDDDSIEYDGEFIDDDEELYRNITPIAVYSSYFMLPAFNKFFSYDESSEWSVFFQPRGGMVRVTDSSGNETVYEIFEWNFEGTEDVLYKAMDDNKYMRWWSDGSGMALFTGNPYSKDACAVVSYYFTDMETARKNLALFPSWRTSGQDNYAVSYGGYDSDDDDSSVSRRSSSSSVCPDCGGKGYRPQPYTYSASSNSYYNTLGSLCPICGHKSEHYHYRCTTCKRF